MVCKTVSTNLPSTVGVRGEEKMTTATFEEHQQNKRKRKLIRAKETLLRLMGIALLVSRPGIVLVNTHKGFSMPITTATAV